MSYFAVTREAGPGWARGGTATQPAISEHTEFMDELADAGFVLLAGPLDGSEQGRLRVLLILEAADEAEIHNRLEADPWATSGQVEVTSIEPWTVFVGADRLRLPQLATDTGRRLRARLAYKR